MRTIVIGATANALMRREHAARPNEEICGLLFGDDAAVVLASPARNVAAMPATAFEIDPAVLLAAHRAQRAGGPRIVGHYHSHPRGRAEPSARDRAAASPGQLWLILAGHDIGGWFVTEHGFERVNLFFESSR